MNKSFSGSCCHLDSSPSLPLLLRFASACLRTPFHLGVGWVFSADTVAVRFLSGTYPFSTVSVRQSPYIFLLASITSLSLYRSSSRCFFGFFCRSSVWTCFVVTLWLTHTSCMIRCFLWRFYMGLQRDSFYWLPRLGRAGRATYQCSDLDFGGGRGSASFCALRRLF